MKTIESRIAPNPKEAQIWIDLNEDPHGLIKKYWNGSAWVVKELPNTLNKEELQKLIDLKFKLFEEQIDDVKTTVKNLTLQHDQYILKLIDQLVTRISKLEEFIITE